MPSCSSPASNQQDFNADAGAREAVSVYKNSTNDFEVHMRHFTKIGDRTLTVLILALFTFTLSMSLAARSQTTPSTTGKSVTNLATAEAAVSANSAAPSGTSAPAQKNPSVPTIAAGDLLKVSVLGAPESDQEVRVAADGNIFLNFVGAVPVAGLTTTQAQTVITKKLVAGGFFTDPQVSVFAKEYATQGVSVLGQVQKPGVYPLLGKRSLFDVLSLAGGTTEKAGKLVSITHRDDPQKPTTVALSNDAAESVHSNVEVFPGDTVVVSTAGVVYVVGDVVKPSGMTMGNAGMTVLQAIAVAAGTSPTAASNKSKLIRIGPDGQRQEIPLPLKDMLASKAPDVRLQAEDIIFVPNSAAKSAGRRTLEAIVQSATGLAIYGVRP
jgi:polysaccharide biosynthesis/export protein